MRDAIDMPPRAGLGKGPADVVEIMRVTVEVRASEAGETPALR